MEETSIYPFDPRSFEEESRLKKQAKRLNALIPVPAVAQARAEQTGHVLDLACGPGLWAMDVASQFERWHTYGLDISEPMIAFARAQSQVRGLRNASFQTGNALHPLPFKDGFFSYVHARMIHGFVLREKWPDLLREIMRVLVPGGFVQLVETERPISNKPIHTQFSGLAAQMGVRNGVSFSPDGQHFGMCAMLAPLLVAAGFRFEEMQAYAIDYGAWPGNPDHQIWCEDTAAAMKQFPAALRKQKRPDAEIKQAEHLVQQAIQEMAEPDFGALAPFLSVVAKKPE